MAVTKKPGIDTPIVMTEGAQNLALKRWARLELDSGKAADVAAQFAAITSKAKPLLPGFPEEQLFALCHLCLNLGERLATVESYLALTQKETASENL